MLVFNGGLTIEQVRKLENGEPIIYDRVPYDRACIKPKNTFDYIPKELYNAPAEVFRKYIADDVYQQQYIFLAKYLKTSLQFCYNREKRNYIMVCNIDEEILNNYIGVGNYDDYRIEYRLPRRFITPDKIGEFLFFEPYDDEQILEFRKKYNDYLDINPEEDALAKRLILEKKLEFNGERNWGNEKL